MVPSPPSTTTRSYPAIRASRAWPTPSPGFVVVKRRNSIPSSLHQLTTLGRMASALPLPLAGLLRKPIAASAEANLGVKLGLSFPGGDFFQDVPTGADAYLLKDGPSRHLLDAINFVRDGGVYVSPLLRGAGIFSKSEASAAREDPLAALSPRESEVFSCLVNGLRPKDIADLVVFVSSIGEGLEK